jgi:hypothetical protein
MFYSFVLLLPRSHRAFIAHRKISSRCIQKMAIHSANEQSTKSNVVVTGAFAGLTATFTPTGSLIPIPEHLIPKELIEWGQAPSCLEIIVSERFQETTIERQTISIYPAIGCAVDNLHTSKAKESIPWTENASIDNIIAMDYGIGKEMTRTETIFALPNNHRYRIIIDLFNKQIQSPIRVNLERRTSTDCTKCTIADGGGLDGRTVSRLLGEELNSGKHFSDEFVSQMDDGDVRLPRGLAFTINGDSLTIKYEDLSITRIFNDDGSVELGLIK